MHIHIDRTNGVRRGWRLRGTLVRSICEMLVDRSSCAAHVRKLYPYTYVHMYSALHANHNNNRVYVSNISACAKGPLKHSFALAARARAQHIIIDLLSCIHTHSLAHTHDACTRPRQ